MHGNFGAVVLIVYDQFPEELDELDFLFIDIDNGLVPFAINQLKFRNQTSVIIELEEIGTPASAELLLDRDVYFENSLFVEQPADSGFFSFAGFSLFDGGKLLGEIEEVIPYPDNPVFQLTIEKKEILIPASSDLVQEIDEKEKIIRMTLPDGLLDLFLNN